MLRHQCCPHLAPSASSSLSSSSCRTLSSNRLQFPAVNFPSSVSIDLLRRSRWRRCRNGEGCFTGNSSAFFCKASSGNRSGRSADSSQSWDREEDQFLKVSLLVPETVRHYYMRKQGFLEENSWHSSGSPHHLSLHSKGLRSDVSPFSHGFLHQFHSPTFFLKVACEGDLILPIVVGEFAIQGLMDTLRDEKAEGCPNQYQFVKNLAGNLGYEVTKVWITKRVVNTYYAQIFLEKESNMENICIDSRPSDAIHVANVFKAPIYVSKEIVLKDAIRIAYGTRRRDTSKTVYDVLLDSAIEGPDRLSEELQLVKKLNAAVKEERYKDAVIWKDELNRLRIPRTES